MEIYGRIPVSPIYEHLFNVLEEGSDVSQTDLEEIKNLMFSPQHTSKRIAGILTELEKFAVTPKTAQNPRVKEGLESLKKTIKQNKEALDGARAVVTIRGSLRYDDPNHMDLDCDIFTLKEIQIETRRISIVRKKLYDSWKVFNKDTEYPVHTTMETLALHIQAIENNDYGYISRNGDLIHYDFSIPASSILNGYVIFSSTKDQKDELRRIVFDMCKRSPFAQAAICLGLEKCLDKRLERRKSK